MGARQDEHRILAPAYRELQHRPLRELEFGTPPPSRFRPLCARARRT